MKVWRQIRRLSEAIVGRPSFDWLIGAVAYYFILTNDVPRAIADLFPDIQRSAYSAAAGVLGIVAGFVVASAYFFAGLDNRRADSLRREHGPVINRTLVGAFLVLSLAAIACVVAILLSPQNPPTSPIAAAPPGSAAAAVVFLAASVVSVVKLVRIAVLSWAMLASQYQHSRTKPKPLP